MSRTMCVHTLKLKYTFHGQNYFMQKLKKNSMTLKMEELAPYIGR